MTDELIKIRDTSKPEMTLDEAMGLCNEKRIDYIIGDHLDESIVDYYSQAVILRDTKRRSKFTDNKLINKLEIILKSIDKDLLTKPERGQYDNIIDKYRC